MTPGVETAVQIMVHLVGLCIAFSVCNVIWSLVQRQVTTARRPLTFLRLGMQLTLLLLYVNYWIREIWGREGLPRGLTAIGTVMVFLLVAIDGIVSEYVNRNEYRQLLRIQAEHEMEQRG